MVCIRQGVNAEWVIRAYMYIRRLLSSATVMDAGIAILGTVTDPALDGFEMCPVKNMSHVVLRCKRWKSAFPATAGITKEPRGVSLPRNKEAMSHVSWGDKRWGLPCFLDAVVRTGSRSSRTRSG